MTMKLKFKPFHANDDDTVRDRAMGEMPKVIAAVDAMAPHVDGMEIKSALTAVAMLAIDTLLAT